MLTIFTWDSVTIVSCIRLKFLRDVVTSSNPTQTLFDITRWSTIEGNTSIYCTCMPMMRQVLVRIFPREFGSELPSNGRSAYHRIFKKLKSTNTAGDVSGPDAIPRSSAKKGSQSGGLSSSGGSSAGKRGFWTAALASANQGDEEDGLSMNHQRHSDSSEAGFAASDDSNITYTTTYVVNYEDSQPDARETHIVMDNLYGRPVLAGQDPTIMAYQASAEYGK